jgi:hypothetical protein
MGEGEYVCVCVREIEREKERERERVFNTEKEGREKESFDKLRILN